MKNTFKKIFICFLILTFASIGLGDFSYAEIDNRPYGGIVICDFDTPDATLKITSEDEEDKSNGFFTTVNESSVPTYTNYDDVIEYVRQNIKNRNSYFQFSSGSTPFDFTNNFYNDVFYHTGNPEEGDYLRWSIISYNTNLTINKANNYYVYTFYFTYTTTYSEEQAFITAVNQLYNDMDLESKTEYQKVLTIYDYICNHVVYDYENLNSLTYVKQYSAYAALINGTAVCQGYALLFYRLALMAGLDSRFIASSEHGWNIVKIGNAYFNLDTTWDAARDFNNNGIVDANEKVDINDYSYFLKSPFEFFDHKRRTEYTTELVNKK